MAVGMTEGSLALDFDVSVSAHGGHFVESASISGATGHVQIAGKQLPAVVYERVPWPEIGANLYQALAVDQDRWWILWFYCQNGALAVTYYESTLGGGAQVDPGAAGTCSEGGGPSRVHVQLPATQLGLPALVGGYRAEGPDLSIGCDGVGRVNLGTRALDVYAFGTVDCSACASSDGHGWRELHAILWDAQAARACFGIFYFQSPGSVKLEYALSLPDLGDPGPVRFDADWQAP
jgi:hypothetical protein